jgi:hypothetical protein
VRQDSRHNPTDLLEAGALPIRAFTPGATAPVSTEELCAGSGPLKEEIAPEVRQAVLRDYGMEGLPETEYELDYLSRRSWAARPTAAISGRNDTARGSGTRV